MPELEPSTPVPTRLQRLAAVVDRARPGRNGRNVRKWMETIGMVLIVFGFVCIVLGWYGAAHSPYLYQEVPYLISGGLLGVALVIGGGVFVHCAWNMRQVEEDRRNALAIVRSVDRLERILRGLDEARQRTNTRANRKSRPVRTATAGAGSSPSPCPLPCWRCSPRPAGRRLEGEAGRAGPGVGLGRAGGGARARTATRAPVRRDHVHGGDGLGVGRHRRHARLGGTAGHAGSRARHARPPPAVAPPRARRPAAALRRQREPRPGRRQRRGHRPGVTATTITVGNIASISGVAPGLTQSAQQATEAWAAYVNSTGGICGRQIKVQPFDDGNDSGTNYADAQQACSSDFAMVGNASGFDDGSAQAVGACGIPDHGRRGLHCGGGQHGGHLRRQPRQRPLLGARAGQLPQDDLPNAISKAAMIYLNVSATQTQAAHEVSSYTATASTTCTTRRRRRRTPTTPPTCRPCRARARST